MMKQWNFIYPIGSLINICWLGIAHRTSKKAPGHLEKYHKSLQFITRYDNRDSGISLE